MHYTSTQQSGAEYDPTHGSEQDANGGGSDSVPAPNEQITTRMERKTQRMARRNAANAKTQDPHAQDPHVQDPYAQNTFSQDHYAQDHHEQGSQSEGYDESIGQYHQPDDVLQQSSVDEDSGGNFDDDQTHVQGAASQRPSQRRNRNTRRSKVSKDEGVKWQDILPEGGELSRRSIKWRELLSFFDATRTYRYRNHSDRWALAQGCALPPGFCDGRVCDVQCSSRRGTGISCFASVCAIFTYLRYSAGSWRKRH